MGGEAAKHSPGAKEAEGPPPEDVATLLSKDRVRYDRVLERALDPTAIDEDGYSSIPELLKTTTERVENDVEELSHYGLTEDSEESGGEGGGVVGKSGKCKSGGHLLGGDSGGSGKSGRNKSSGGTVGADKPSDGGKAGGGDSDGDKSASPSTEPPASIALEDKPPAPKGGVNLTGTNWASKSGSAEKSAFFSSSLRKNPLRINEHCSYFLFGLSDRSSFIPIHLVTLRKNINLKMHMQS
ncbi:hypothetical protein PR002_g15650 [Phytophthora rubi]|uniref:Uncharacterized protein n=1 Tax=Phytophthora rubi TaxID=129364 RepID=A0A6A3KQC6_9STRA|nr:hypothetical protein PR002_g15650 [Phytophthora rubi]